MENDRLSTTTPIAQNGAAEIWLPYTLRWPCFFATFSFTSMLGIAVVVVHSISWRNSGLVTDDGSGIVQIGSKFAPTLLATIYVFLASILLDDVKRTEPFARLSSPAGAQADLSVSWTADAWWNALFSSFPSRHRKTNWAMLCATLAFVLGFLILSPLSSSLIVSQTIVSTQETQFLQLNIKPSMPIHAEPSSETFYRTIASVLRNVTTSAWISDQYAVLPFWPASSENAPLGPILFETDQTWTATTSVFSTELSCEPMQLTNVSDTYVHGNRYAYLSTQSGCAVFYPFSGDENGAILWSNPKNSHSKLAFYDSPNPSSAPPPCSQYDEYYVTAVVSLDTVVIGEACEISYFVGDSLVTASRINGQSVVKIDEQQYHANRKPISPTTANISTFKDAFLSNSWNNHLSASDLAGYSDQAKPFIEGPGNLLAALYDFSPDRVLADSTEKRRAMRQRIEGRFFGELLQDCFNNNQLHEPDRISGLITTSPRRLVVVSAVAVTLEVILIVILILLLVVFVSTRLARRSLGLDADPASTMSIAKLLSDDTATMQSFLNVPATTEEKSKVNPLTYRYRIEQGKVRLISRESTVSFPSRDSVTTGTDTQQDQERIDLRDMEKSTVFGIWPLIVLIIMLTIVMITILTLYIYSRGHKLYQKAFVYTISVSITGVDLGDANPASIVTTLVAVIIGLWWGSLDTNLRRAQPFLALATGPVNGFKGASISYRSSYLLWASARAARRKHWLLFLVCTGAFLSQILTIAMSSLWSRQPGLVPVSMQIPKTLELRSVPILSKGIWSNTPRGLDRRSTALLSLFGNIQASWVYGAVVQLSLNGPEPTWSSQGWNFVPVDLTPVNLSDSSIQGSSNGSNSIGNLLTKVTLETPAVRGRVDCSEYRFLDNTSFWLDDWTLPEDTELNPNISQGYELGSYLFLNGSTADYPVTTLFSSDRRLQCCQNMTNDTSGQSSIGYWSPNLGDQQSYYPAISKAWPANFTVKWIRGNAMEATLSSTDDTEVSEDQSNRLIWTKKPAMTALNCVPIIETANASVTVDVTNGRVIDFRLLESPQEDKFAWTDDFEAYKHPSPPTNEYAVNMTTSHGILFILGLLGAADLENLVGATTLRGVPGGDSFYSFSAAERLEDQTFNIRDTGLNVDYMTYAMLSLVNNNHSALLDGKVLKETAQRTFSTFFQHFVNNKISMTNGGYLYQSMDEKLPADIGEPYFPTRPPTNGSNTNGNTTDRIAHVTISRPMEILSMSGPAAWICISILGYLIVTCVLLAVASKSYNRLLLRQVDSIADIAFLIASSRRLLKIARERPLEGLKHDKTVEAKLDWFVTDQGDWRWGIEVVGEDPDLTVLPTPSPRQSNKFSISDESTDFGEGVSWYDAVISDIMAVGR
ncbi:hypothetical protein O1611_g940 [Lasiodiplodia mahajangana]|uniref:Uncharacterized protein n=1 Tax=Lasiodiplodia mahajangana TaxID=1108764 RepID=A0ACC2JYT1_9PEZI|nr:hypothetical protein O1611_g940 [Lasiodiplodia mahajangana]